MDNLQAIRLFKNRKPGELSPEELEAFRARLDQNPALYAMLGGREQVEAWLNQAPTGPVEPALADGPEEPAEPAPVHPEPAAARHGPGPLGALVLVMAGFAAGMAFAAWKPEWIPGASRNPARHSAGKSSTNPADTGKPVAPAAVAPIPVPEKSKQEIAEEKLHDDFDTAFEQAQTAVVEIHTGDTVLSGTLIDHNYVLTSGHLALGAGRELTVTLPPGNPCQGHVVSLMRNYDLALVEVQGDLEGRALPMLSRDRINQVKRAIAFGRDPEGELQAVPVEIDSVRGTMILARGNYTPFPGGPVLNEQGELVGMQTTKFEGYNRITRLMTSLRNPSRLRNKRFGLWAEGTGPDIEVDVFPLKTGMKVEKIPAGSAAEDKLRIGDIIEAIEGKAVNRYQGMDKALRHQDPGETVRLRIDREGERMELRVKLVARSQDK